MGTKIRLASWLALSLGAAVVVRKLYDSIDGIDYTIYGDLDRSAEV
jgi:hypothetical protein